MKKLLVTLGSIGALLGMSSAMADVNYVFQANPMEATTTVDPTSRGIADTVTVMAKPGMFAFHARDYGGNTQCHGNFRYEFDVEASAAAKAEMYRVSFWTKCPASYVTEATRLVLTYDGNLTHTNEGYVPSDRGIVVKSAEPKTVTRADMLALVNILEEAYIESDSQWSRSTIACWSHENSGNLGSCT